jgi:hypothetical protein
MEDDYETTRRRQAEERRRQREEQRKKRRDMLGLSKYRDCASKDFSIVEERCDDSSPILFPRKRAREDGRRMEKLKEEKRAEEGLRLIEEMYGSSYLNADILLSPPHEDRSKQFVDIDERNRINNISRTDRCNIPSITCMNKTRMSDNSMFKENDATLFLTGDARKVETTSMSGQNCSQNHEVSLVSRVGNNEDSSSDDDIVALARSLQEKKRKLDDKNIRSSPLAKQSTSVKELNKKYTSGNYDSEESNDDIVSLARDASHKKHDTSKRSSFDRCKHEDHNCESDEDLVSVRLLLFHE